MNNQPNHTSKEQDIHGVRNLLKILGFDNDQVELWLAYTNYDTPANLSPFTYLERMINKYSIEKNKKDISLREGIQAMINEATKTVRQDNVSEDFFKNASSIPELQASSNITFIPGKRPQDVRVFAGDVEITNIARASVIYDSEMDLPILSLDIVDPAIRDS